MRKTLRTSVLLLALTVSTQAGEVLTPPVVTPPPPQSATAGEIQLPSASLIEAALALLSIVLP